MCYNNTGVEMKTNTVGFNMFSGKNGEHGARMSMSIYYFRSIDGSSK